MSDGLANGGWRYPVRFRAVASTGRGRIDPPELLDEAGQIAALERAIADAWSERHLWGTRLEDPTLAGVREALMEMVDEDRRGTGAAERRVG